MNLYRILMRHYSQKDYKEGVVKYILCCTDEDVYRWINTNLEYGCWFEKEENNELFNIYNDDYDVIGQETFKERMIRLKGEYFYEDYEPTNLYYGATCHGWEVVKENISEYEIKALREIGILEKEPTK